LLPETFHNHETAAMMKHTRQRSARTRFDSAFRLPLPSSLLFRESWSQSRFVVCHRYSQDVNSSVSGFQRRQRENTATDATMRLINGAAARSGDGKSKRGRANVIKRRSDPRSNLAATRCGINSRGGGAPLPPPRLPAPADFRKRFRSRKRDTRAPARSAI